jgi:hypothetical protein
MPDILITPPIRTPLTSSDGDAAAGTTRDSSGVTRTTRDWWLYWDRLGAQANSNAKLVSQGTHADRPAATDSPDGALYVETDRGAIYQARNGVWQYLAGTMWGTITPDQRPTDLGVNDGGFDFRGTDDAREFIWSQTQWIEVTEVRYGTHAGRPNPLDVANGALYVEFDRGGAIYQNQNNVWKYLAGTMFGTFSPDQRPTDLGVNDAGFNFRTTDVARQFLWSQSAWIEVTAAQYGIHSARPAPASITQGSLYIESDRGGVIYQNQAGVWKYLAGTMFGTLSPDQRPTDLGVNDAGFNFRATDQQRQFLWSQTAWVETTPPNNTIQWVSASTPLTLTTTMADIPGLALTLPRSGVYHVSGVIDFNSNDSQALLLGQLVVNGVAQGAVVVYQAFNVPSRATVAQQWMITAGAVNIPIKMQANKNSGAGGSLAHVQSTLSAVWISP